MRLIIISGLLALALTAYSQTNVLFPEFTDVLIIKENESLTFYIDGEKIDSTPSLQSTLDKLSGSVKKDGVLLRFEPDTVPLPDMIKTAESIYRCGIPVIYIFDAVMAYETSEIIKDPYLSALASMHKSGRFLRVLDLNCLTMLSKSSQPHQEIPIPAKSSAVASSILIVMLACTAYAAGFYIAKLKAPWWTLGYIIPVILTAVIAVGRWHPTLEMNPFFRLLMHERREYIVMALSTALLLAVPASKLKRKLSAVLATTFAALFVLHFSVLPFLLPAFNQGTLLSINTSFDQFGACLQNTGYTCGPAAAVTALREFGISAEEGELAIFSHSTSSAGTPPELLCKAIDRLYDSKDIKSDFRTFRSIGDIKNHLPLIAVVKFGFLVDHFVTVLRVTDDYVTVADPARGMRIMTHDNFERDWRNTGITLTGPHQAAYPCHLPAMLRIALQAGPCYPWSIQLTHATLQATPHASGNGP